jgi:hypothetical protein
VFKKRTHAANQFWAKLISIGLKGDNAGDSAHGMVTALENYFPFIADGFLFLRPFRRNAAKNERELLLQNRVLFWKRVIHR